MTTQHALVALQATSIKTSLGRVLVLDDVSVSFKASRWTCIVGPNGAGKSTLLKVLAGLLPSGARNHHNVQLLGKPYGAWPAKERAKAIAWLGQGEPAPLHMNAYDLVMLGRLPHMAWLAAPCKQDHAAVQAALQATNAWDWRDRLLGELSGGERQRVLLARLLAVDAQILLMDEPLANLDPPHQADWLQLIKALTALGKTIITVLHELPIALQADELLVMDKGRAVCQGDPRAGHIQQGLQAVFDSRLRIDELGGELIVRLAS